jgi:polyribonucleotide 5'-hydroxyl-kinase
MPPSVDIDTSDLPPVVGERHILQPQEELRVEVSFSQSHACSFTLQKGSCELWGCELALGKPYTIHQGGVKLALFTWHGCVVDVDAGGHLEISYIGIRDETEFQVSFVNTHAQLEALRDDAASAIASDAQTQTQGPRVLIVGPPESGKTSLCKTLIAYACKLGRTPLWVDLDPMENALSVPGTLAVAPMTAAAVTVETYCTTGLPPNSIHPLVEWHGSSNQLHADLFGAQVESLAAKINQRLEGDEQARSSGIIVNTNGSMIQDEGFDLLKKVADSLQITVILVMGHDRLYSMLTTHYKTNANSSNSSPDPQEGAVKILKLPRSGGIVSRSADYTRSARSRSVKRYFYGEMVDPPATATSSSTTSSSAKNGASTSANPATAPAKVPQLTPFLLQLPFADITIYKLSSIALSASLLPVAAAQSTDAIQIQKVEWAEALQHMVLAVCHPAAVEKYEMSQRARDLVTAGVAGFCAVERVIMETDMVHLLSPCAGSLPSQTLLCGDVTWME